MTLWLVSVMSEGAGEGDGEEDDWCSCGWCPLLGEVMRHTVVAGVRREAAECNGGERRRGRKKRAVGKRGDRRVERRLFFGDEWRRKIMK